MAEKDKTFLNGLDRAKDKIIIMLEKVKTMLSLATDGFNKDKVEFLNQALKIEQEINQMEAELTKSLVEFSSQSISEDDIGKAKRLRQMVGDIERSGDCVKELVRRIEMKINEGILFSDKAVKEYNQVYAEIQRTFENSIYGLRAGDKQKATLVLEKGKTTAELLANCATEHEERLVRGICPRRASGIFLDILDFMGGINRHLVQIAENILS